MLFLTIGYFARLIYTHSVFGAYVLFRFVQYKPTSLEKNYKHELLTEVDLGVNIDLIDPDTYAINQDGMVFYSPCLDCYIILLNIF